MLEQALGAWSGKGREDGSTRLFPIELFLKMQLISQFTKMNRSKGWKQSPVQIHPHKCRKLPSGYQPMLAYLPISRYRYSPISVLFLWAAFWPWGRRWLSMCRNLPGMLSIELFLTSISEQSKSGSVQHDQGQSCSSPLLGILETWSSQWSLWAHASRNNMPMAL